MLRDIFKSFDDFLTKVGKLNDWLLIALLASVPVMSTFAYRYLVQANLVGPAPTNSVFEPKIPMWIKLATALVAAPILETVIFQVIALYVLRRLMRLNTLIAAALTAVAFAFEHRHSVVYVVATFILGFCFSTVYVAKSHEGQHAFLVVVAGHALGNSIVFYMVYGMAMFGLWG